MTCLISPKKTLGKVAIGVTLAFDAAVDVSAEDGVRFVGGSGENAKPVPYAVIDLTVGVSGVAGGETVANTMEIGLRNEATNKATATLSKQGKQQARNLAKKAGEPGAQIVEKQAVSLSTKGGGEILKHMPIEPEKEPLRLQFQQGYMYNPSFRSE